MVRACSLIFDSNSGPSGCHPKRILKGKNKSFENRDREIPSFKRNLGPQLVIILSSLNAHIPRNVRHRG
jgi:hypothetical protein